MSLYAPLRLVLLFWYKLNAVENENRCSESWRSKHLSAVSAPEAPPGSWLLGLTTWLLKITGVSGTTRKQKILLGVIHEKTAAEQCDLIKSYKVKCSPKASRIPGLFILVLACSVFTLLPAYSIIFWPLHPKRLLELEPLRDGILSRTMRRHKDSRLWTFHSDHTANLHVSVTHWMQVYSSE